MTQKGDPEVPYHPSASFAQTNLARASGIYHIGEESSAFQPYDLSIRTAQPGENGAVFGPETTGPLDQGGAHFTGQNDHSSGGVPKATQYELPVSPPLSIANLQHADVFSGHLPRIRYAIGNSFAHPLLKAENALQDYAPLGYGLYDHSYLSNTRLWDRYYFSTLGSEETVINSTGGRSMDTVVKEWLDLDASGTSVPLFNSGIKVYLPQGKTKADVATELLSSNTAAPGAYRKAAAYHLLDGAFNVNSTSVEAWKALLSTTNILKKDIRIPYFDGTLGFTNAKKSGFIVAAFSRFRIPNSENSADFSSSDDVALWQGYRELDEGEIQRLAEEIVKQVRFRGPFLSLAEFVNRRLADPDDPRSEMGAIDAAIKEAGLNNSFVAEVGRA